MHRVFDAPFTNAIWGGYEYFIMRVKGLSHFCVELDAPFTISRCLLSGVLVVNQE